MWCSQEFELAFDASDQDLARMGDMGWVPCDRPVLPCLIQAQIRALGKENEQLRERVHALTKIIVKWIPGALTELRLGEPEIVEPEDPDADRNVQVFGPMIVHDSPPAGTPGW